MKKTAFFTDERTFWHSVGQYILEFKVGGWVQPPSGASHAESPESKRRLKNLIIASGLHEELAIETAKPLTKEQVALVHTESYLNEFKRVSDLGGGDLSAPHNLDTPIGPGTYDIALLSAGLATQAVRDVYTGRFKNAYALSRPPGHHATSDQAIGFCYLNNIAVAIENVKKELGLKRVAIMDVHHGNGQQDIYYNSEDVLTISLHQDMCYPNDYVFNGASQSSTLEARGENAGTGYNMNLPFFPGAGHDAYLYAMEKVIAPAIRDFKPEMIIVACGFDANAFDPLGRILLHSDSFRLLTREVIKLADEVCEGKVVYTHEGGYAESYVPFCGMAVMEELSGIKTEVEDPMLGYFIQQQPNARFNDMQNAEIDRWAEFFAQKTS